MESKSLREAAKNKVIAAGNAQAVFNELGKIENDREANLNRWAWELLQNARDAAGRKSKVSVSVVFNGKTLRFQHNGPPFRDEEIAHLIFHGSTKHHEHAGIGRFGPDSSPRTCCRE
ncbi:MAG: ATP-binding protein [Pirellulaceae bacterium]|nr:ATP-binding protein [Pirellulaceae bacterium]